MRKVYAIAAVCLLLIFATALPAQSQTCPAAGSGAAGVNAFEAACTSGADPANTCNGEFSIDLLSSPKVGSQVTLTYKVCKLGTAPNVKNLSHWVLGLDQLVGSCLATGKTLTNVFAGCSILDPVGGETCFLQSSQPDPTTQLVGAKFDNLSVGDGQCQTYTVTLNETALSSNDTTEGTVSPTSVTFTTANWNVAQTVTVTGVGDSVVDGNVAYTIVTASSFLRCGSCGRLYSRRSTQPWG